MPRKPDPVWEFFNKIKIDNKSGAQCKSCKKKYGAENIHNMETHLRHCTSLPDASRLVFMKNLQQKPIFPAKQMVAKIDTLKKQFIHEIRLRKEQTKKRARAPKRKCLSFHEAVKQNAHEVDQADESLMEARVACATIENPEPSSCCQVIVDGYSNHMDTSYNKDCAQDGSGKIISENGQTLTIAGTNFEVFEVDAGGKFYDAEDSPPDVQSPSKPSYTVVTPSLVERPSSSRTGGSEPLLAFKKQKMEDKLASVNETLQYLVSSIKQTSALKLPEEPGMHFFIDVAEDYKNLPDHLKDNAKFEILGIMLKLKQQARTEKEN